MDTVDAVLLDRVMTMRFGPDYRDKAVVTAVGSFPLRDVFDECGLRDPQAPPEHSGAVGLWQIHSPRRPRAEP